MDDEIRDAVAGWDTRPVSDGLEGLHDLADAEFSGAVTDGIAWAFFLNGRVVGVFDGTLDSFEEASLTAHVAPDPSLPLLYTMQENGGETRAQYYTNDTPLSETDETLTAGNFVGYVELSENVLSGDYYVVYYGGRSLPVAFVGNEPTLLTGPEAFERADDEVGIYSVVDADVSVVDLPERPDDATTAAAAAAATDDGGAAATDQESPMAAETSATDGTTDDGAEDATGEASDVETEAETSMETAASDTSAEDGTEEAPAVDGTDAMSGATEDGTAATGTDASPGDAATTSAGAGAGDGTVGGADGTVDADGATDSAAAPTGTAPPASTESGTPVDDDGGTAPDEGAEVARLRRELEAARRAAEEAESERDEYRAEADRLRERVAELESKLADAGADLEEETTRTLSRDEALEATNLFVRYGDKSEGTLEGAAKGAVPEEQLRANLRLEYHTEFETAGVRVEGREFESFLRSTREHRFARWLLTTLPYEIRGTDARASLSKLFDSIERIDRIDFDGEVATGPEGESTAAFDVVFRDRMGNPLFVAAFDDGRDPTGPSTVESLLKRAESVSRSDPDFAAAFAVTASFFDAGAMETAVEATRGGLFSRSSRLSYVKLSRKLGFHLCLTEAREDDFFLTVPEL